MLMIIEIQGNLYKILVDVLKTISYESFIKKFDMKHFLLVLFIIYFIITYKEYNYFYINCMNLE